MTTWRIYIYDDVEQVSSNWHDGGAVVIVTDREPQTVWNEHQVAVRLDPETLPDPVATHEVVGSAVETVHRFQDAGCC